MLTTALAVLLIYRSALSMHEDDQLFLDNAESHLEKEQQQLTVRMDKLRPFVTILGASSGLLVLADGGPVAVARLEQVLAPRTGLFPGERLEDERVGAADIADPDNLSAFEKTDQRLLQDLAPPSLQNLGAGCALLVEKPAHNLLQVAGGRQQRGIHVGFRGKIAHRDREQLGQHRNLGRIVAPLIAGKI